MPYSGYVTVEITSAGIPGDNIQELNITRQYLYSLVQISWMNCYFIVRAKMEKIFFKKSK